jgi:hypothetical protein
MKTNNDIVKKETGCSSECQNPENHKMNVPLHTFLLTFLTNYKVVNFHIWKSHIQRHIDLMILLLFFPPQNYALVYVGVYIVCPNKNVFTVHYAKKTKIIIIKYLGDWQVNDNNLN